MLKSGLCPTSRIPSSVNTPALAKINLLAFLLLMKKEKPFALAHYTLVSKTADDRKTLTASQAMATQSSLILSTKE
jgi:hypothetical protein